MFTFTYTYTQERYWPHLLDQMRKNCFPKVEKAESKVDSDEAPEGEGTASKKTNEYDHVLLKSDYWKKIRGDNNKRRFGCG